MVCGSPLACIKHTEAPVSAKTFKLLGSKLSDETSLKILAPFNIPALATSAFLVSIDIIPRFAIPSTTGDTRFNSENRSTKSAPGLVLSPPISMIDAPSSIIFFPRSIAAVASLY